MKTTAVILMCVVIMSMPVFAFEIPTRQQVLASYGIGSGGSSGDFASRAQSNFSSWQTPSSSFPTSSAETFSEIIGERAQSFQAARRELIEQFQARVPGNFEHQFRPSPIGGFVKPVPSPTPAAPGRMPGSSGISDGIPRIPFTPAQCATFRDRILNTYGFTAEAAAYIQQNIKLEITNETRPDVGGGWWAPWDSLVHLNSTQHEAAVHEFAHTWYDNLTPDNPNMPAELAAATVQLAGMDPEQNPQYAPAIAEAQTYVDRGWADSTSPNYAPWEIFASFASYTMGQIQEGVRQLPEYMWGFYETLFTGDLTAAPYYEGGHR